MQWVNHYSRFHQDEIAPLMESLRISPDMRTSSGTRFTDMEGFLITLRRLQYPKTLNDMVPEFGRHPTEISVIFNHMLYDLNDTWGHLLDDWDQVLKM